MVKLGYSTQNPSVKTHKHSDAYNDGGVLDGLLSIVGNKSLESYVDGRVALKFPVVNADLNTATGLLSGTSTLNSDIQFVLNDYAFFPSITADLATAGVSGDYMRLYAYDSADPGDTVARFRIYANVGNCPYAVRWRYVTASEPVIIAVVVDMGGNEHVWVSEPVRDSNGRVVDPLTIKHIDSGVEIKPDVYETEVCNVPTKTPYKSPRKVLEEWRAGILKTRKIRSGKIR